MTAAECVQVAVYCGNDQNGHWLGHGEPQARLTLRIGSHDRRLFRHIQWLRKYWTEEELEHPMLRTRFAKANWIYFGTIAANKIIAFDEAVPQTA